MGGGRFRTVFLERAAAGGSTDYWETAWAEEKQEPPGFLLDALQEHLAGRRLVLESGCGQAAVVGWLEANGHTAIGIDLAREALAHARGERPALRLTISDVAQLPFPDSTFDSLLSLGVVEHFEHGPREVLAEQRRVLRSDGLLLLTVPQKSWFRAWTDLWNLALMRRGEYRQRRRIVAWRTGMAPGPPGRAPFHQYEFSRRQLLSLMEQSGFEVELWQALDIGTAITESRLLARLVGSSASSPSSATSSDSATAESVGQGTVTSPTTHERRSLRAVAARLLLSRGDAGPVVRLMRATATRAFGHLQMVVARPSDETAARLAARARVQRARSAMAEAAPSENRR